MADLTDLQKNILEYVESGKRVSKTAILRFFSSPHTSYAITKAYRELSEMNLIVEIEEQTSKNPDSFYIYVRLGTPEEIVRKHNS